MKILKMPFDTIIKCDCGCEFEFGPEDIKKDEEYGFSGIYKITYVTCPICGEEHSLLEFY